MDDHCWAIMYILRTEIGVLILCCGMHAMLHAGAGNRGEGWPRHLPWLTNIELDNGRISASISGYVDEVSSSFIQNSFPFI